MGALHTNRALRGQGRDFLAAMTEIQVQTLVPLECGLPAASIRQCVADVLPHGWRVCWWYYDLLLARAASAPGS